MTEVVEGRGEDIKEYTVGAALSSQGESYDPQVDTIVRVQARRLRVRLRDYYLAEGVSAAMQIEIPEGTYVPVFHPSHLPWKSLRDSHISTRHDHGFLKQQPVPCPSRYTLYRTGTNYRAG